MKSMIPIWERIVAIFIYMLPFSDVVHLGKNLIIEFPVLKFIVIPSLPIIFIKSNIFLGGLLLFLLLFVGVVRNTKISYFLRFNTLQALLMDIAILIIVYGLEILIKPLGSILLLIGISNTIFIATLALTIFSITQSLQGKEPDLPILSEAVRMQI